MSKKLIRLTESDLHRIVKESVNKILSEAEYTDNGGYRFWNTFDQPSLQQQLDAIPPKIPNFDRSQGYDFYKGQWMNGKDAIAAQERDREAWIKDKKEKEERKRKADELLAPYRPLLKELGKLSDACENAITYEDEEGNIWVAINGNALEKLRQGAIAMRFIHQLLKGDKHIVEDGYKMACEALNELGDEEINKPKIYNLLQQVKKILDEN